MAKYLDNDGLLYLWQKIKNVFASKDALNDKVDKVTGKGLSTNDYTTDEKNKLNGIEAGAQVNHRVGVDGNSREILGYSVNDDMGALIMFYNNVVSRWWDNCRSSCLSKDREQSSHCPMLLPEKLTQKTEKGLVQTITPRQKKTNWPHLGRHQLTP